VVLHQPWPVTACMVCCELARSSMYPTGHTLDTATQRSYRQTVQCISLQGLYSGMTTTLFLPPPRAPHPLLQ